MLVKQWRKDLSKRKPRRSDEWEELGRLAVCVRKRPMNAKEQQSKACFDIVTPVSPRYIVLHEPKVKVDMSRSLDHHEVCFV